MKRRGEVLRVPPLKLVINKEQSQRYRILQVNGACSFSDEDGDLSLNNDNILQSYHDDGNWIA